MRQLVSPVYIGALNGRPLRFFKAPTDEPHLVWHSWDDLIASADLPRDLRRTFKTKMQADHGPAIKIVATPQGITTIAPHFMAQGFIGCMIENGYFPASIEMSYAVQSVDAWNALMANLAHNASMDLFLAAFSDTNKLDQNRNRT